MAHFTHGGQRDARRGGDLECGKGRAGCGEKGRGLPTLVFVRYANANGRGTGELLVSRYSDFCQHHRIKQSPQKKEKKCVSGKKTNTVLNFTCDTCDRLLAVGGKMWNHAGPYSIL